MGDFRDGLTLEQRTHAIQRGDRATAVYAVCDVPVRANQRDVGVPPCPKLEDTWKRCDQPLCRFPDQSIGFFVDKEEETAANAPAAA